MSEGRVFMVMQGMIDAAYQEAYGRSRADDSTAHHRNVAFVEFLERCAREAAKACPDDEVSAAMRFTDIMRETMPMMHCLRRLFSEQFGDDTRTMTTLPPVSTIDALLASEGPAWVRYISPVEHRLYPYGRAFRVLRVVGSRMLVVDVEGDENQTDSRDFEVVPA